MFVNENVFLWISCMCNCNPLQKNHLMGAAFIRVGGRRSHRYLRFRTLVRCCCWVYSFVRFGSSFYFGLQQTSPSAINVMKVICGCSFGSLFTFRRSMHFEPSEWTRTRIPVHAAQSISSWLIFSTSINCPHTLNFSASWHRYSCRLTLFVPRLAAVALLLPPAVTGCLEEIAGSTASLPSSGNRSLEYPRGSIIPIGSASKEVSLFQTFLTNLCTEIGRLVYNRSYRTSCQVWFNSLRKQHSYTHLEHGLMGKLEDIVVLPNLEYMH